MCRSLYAVRGTSCKICHLQLTPSSITRAFCSKKPMQQAAACQMQNGGPSLLTGASPSHSACSNAASALATGQAAEGKVKRKLALHVAYCGTGYAGLQLQRGVEGLTTVEAALEEAIARSGGILASNRGDGLQKIDWSRSSRTDKGVHSLATVIGLKMECDVGAFERGDPEGLAIAAGINAHLPRQIRVLAAQRAQQKFDARQKCEARGYHYFLPAAALRLRLDGGGEDAGRLRLLRACLALFTGTRAFHNFTKRRLYRVSDRARRRRKLGEAPSGNTAEGEGISLGLGGGVEGQDEAAEEDSHSTEQPEIKSMDSGNGAGLQQPAAGASRGMPASDDGAEEMELDAPDQAVADMEALPEGGDNDGSAGTRPWLREMQFRWSEDIDDADRITRGHYRHIHTATADDPAPLVPGGTPCIKVAFHGQSFMLHQIRHMVGAAVGVSRGIFPLAWVEACLWAPARAYMPLAPAHVLVLSETVMLPFRDDVLAKIGHVSGPRLELREGGRAAQQRFAAEVLYPALEGLLTLEEWDAWDETLRRITYDERDMAAFLALAEATKVQVAERRAERALLREEDRHLVDGLAVGA